MGEDTLSLQVLSVNNKASGGLWPQGPFVNKVAPHLYCGRRTSEGLTLTQTFIIVLLSLLRLSTFAVFYSVRVYEFMLDVSFGSGE